METMLVTVLVVLFVELLLAFYALVRNNWVLRKRREILRSSTLTENGALYPYDWLPPYEEMLHGHGFWRWDIKKYLPERSQYLLIAHKKQKKGEKPWWRSGIIWR